jgi:hypothetical protein
MPDGARYQWAYCQEKGTTLPVPEAIRTRGALGFVTEKNGIVGHVAFFLGDGHTMEAKGAAYGCGVFSAYNRAGKPRFDKAALIPGVDYSDHPQLAPAGDPATVSELTLPDGSGGWRLHADGGVFTWGRAPFWGSYPGLPAKDRQGARTFRTITTVGDGKPGYVLISDKGERYVFRPPS